MPDKQEFSLYNGEVILTFAEKSHRYKVSDSGGKPVHCPSVTTILNVLAKPALVEWGVKCACNYVEDNLKLLISGDSFSVQDVFKIVTAARTAHDRTRQEAADIGTSVHDWLAASWLFTLGRGPQPEIPKDEKVQNCIEAATDWFVQHKIRPLKIEEAQYSRIHKFCGRPDFIGYIDDTLSVLDYKSTKFIYPEVALQMTAYGYMHEEEFGENPATRWALRLDKETGEFEARKYSPETFNLDWETFKACFLIYDRLKHLRRKPKPEKQDFLEGL
jgi:hypothetical protein